MKTLAPLALAIVLILQVSTGTQMKHDLAGTWRLVSASSVTEGGERNESPYGPNPKGILIYTTDGEMAVMISYGGRKALSIADRATAPAAERAEAFATFLAYSGRYTVIGDRVIHHVEVASFENWVNTDQIRIVKHEGERITLATPSIKVNSKLARFDLVWERMK